MPSELSSRGGSETETQKAEGSSANEIDPSTSHNASSGKEAGLFQFEVSAHRLECVVPRNTSSVEAIALLIEKVIIENVQGLKVRYSFKNSFYGFQFVCIFTAG